MSKCRIIGIDPSLRNFGIAKATLNLDTMKYVIDDLILIRPEDEKGKTVRKNSDDLRRCIQLHEGFLEACQGASFAIAEVPHGSQSARAMASYGMCVGVLAACPIPLIQVNASEVKRASVGNEKATKKQMIEWAMDEHPYAPWIMRKVKGMLEPVDANEHLADSVAAIEAGIRTQQFKQAAAMFRSMAA